MNPGVWNRTRNRTTRYRCSANMDAADYDSRTALMIACSHGAAEAAAVLVALPGIKLDAVDHFGNTAKSEATKNGNAAVIALFA